jgi:glycerol-3-phosphate acyltransferase PlsY
VTSRNKFKRMWTTVGLGVPSWVLTLLAGVIAGVLAGHFAPSVDTRKDADGQAATYGVFLAVACALFVAFAAVPKLRSGRLRNTALAASVLAFLTAVAGMFTLPLDLYAYMFAATVAALVVAVASLATILR